MTINLNFMVGGAMRKVIIKGRTISFLTAELNFVPLIVDLDKLDKEKEKIKKMKMDQNYLKELAKLKTEKQLADDIIMDWKKQGWRLVHENGNN